MTTTNSTISPTQRRTPKGVKPAPTPLRVLRSQSDQGPYTQQLDHALRTLGVTVTSSARPTRSQTLNLLFAPVWLLWCRARGYRIWHTHWTWEHRPPWANRAGLRRGFRWWFQWRLRFAKTIGYRIVWTSHNVLPHQPVFDDDTAARHALIGHTDAVIAIHTTNLTALAQRWNLPPVTAVIGYGPYHHNTDGPDPADVGGPADYGFGPAVQHIVALIGVGSPYKGIDVLTAAAERLDPSIGVLIAGRDTGRYASITAPNVQIIDRYLTDNELAAIHTAAALIVLPYRGITNSGALHTALSQHRPAVVSDLPALAGIGGDAVIVWDQTTGPDGLAAIIAHTLATPERIDAAALAARQWAAKQPTWDDVAAATVAVYRSVLNP